MIGWIFIVSAFAAFDWWLIEKREVYPDHGKELVVKGIIGIIYGACVFNVADGYEGLAVFCFEVGTYYAFFEITLNRLRDFPLFYLGKEAWLDRLLDNRRGLYWTLKILALIASIISAVYLIIN